jgi:hypothetical protein
MKRERLQVAAFLTLCVVTAVLLFLNLDCSATSPC